MSAELKLLKLYDQWRVLTDLEGQAIRAGDWASLFEQQNAKGRLQERIRLAWEVLPGELQKSGDNGKVLESRFGRIVDDLILLERENERTLAEQRRLAEEQRRQLQQSSRNLRQLQRAYAPGYASAWHTYS